MKGVFLLGRVVTYQGETCVVESEPKGGWVQLILERGYSVAPVSELVPVSAEDVALRLFERRRAGP